MIKHTVIGVLYLILMFLIVFDDDKVDSNTKLICTLVIAVGVTTFFGISDILEKLEKEGK